MSVDNVIVGNSLGRSSSDLGTLCTHAGINKWSKYKPIVSTTPLDNTVIRSLKSGLTLTQSYFSALRTYVLSNFNRDTIAMTAQKSWPHTLPGANDIKRIDDFDGYAHNAVPMFSIPSGSTPVWTTNGSASNPKVITISQSQVSGGLVPGDIFDSNYHLGVILVNIDSDAKEIALVAINGASIVTDQTVTIDVTHIVTSLFVACLFVYQGTPGITQIDYPTTGQLNDIDQYGSVYPIENGMYPAIINNFYVFPIMLWRYPRSFDTVFSSNNSYTLYPGTTPPVTSGGEMEWTSSAQLFRIEPDVEPAVTLKWKIGFQLYKQSSSWTDNVWRLLFVYPDIDGLPLMIWMRTTPYMEFRVTLEEQELAYMQTDYELSTDDLNPTSIEVFSHKAGDQSVHSIGLKVYGETLDFATISSAYMTQESNPPIFHFGQYDLTYPAPVGLSFQLIEVIALASY